MNYEAWIAGGAIIPDRATRNAVFRAGSELASELTKTHGGIEVFAIGVVGPLVAFSGLPEYVEAFSEMLEDATGNDEKPEAPGGPVWSPTPDVD